MFGQATGCLGTGVVSNALTVVAQPPHITPVQASTIPTVFLTADACLHTAAHIGPGDRCLIHAATGMPSHISGSTSEIDLLAGNVPYELMWTLHFSSRQA